jgi:hypothetical protein
MAYAQISYPQLQGMKNPRTGAVPRYSIHDIGCFLTAFCNLMSLRYGRDINPLDLNNIFANSGVWTDVDDGILDDLAWESISRFDGSITVGRKIDHGRSQDAGLPATRNAIVKFAYISPNTKQFTTHFTLYDGDGYIIDSWDGKRKHISATWYGNPVAFAEYDKAAAQAVMPPPPQPTFEVVENYPEGKQVKLNKQPTNLWGMNYRELSYMAEHPVEAHSAEEIWTVTNKVRHVNGYYYYRREGQVDGFNVLDCDDYTPPPVTPPTGQLKDYTPIPFPAAEKYTLVTSVQGYAKPSDARNGENTTQPVEPGDYYVYAAEQGMKNISDSAAKAGVWINPADNVEGRDVTEAPIAVPEPTPEPVEVVATPSLPIALSYEYLSPDRDPVRFRSLNTTVVTLKDLENPISAENPEGVKPIELPPTFELDILQSTVKNGVEYYLPSKSLQGGWHHGIPSSMLKLVPVQPRHNFFDFNDDGHVDAADVPAAIDGFIDFGSKHFNAVKKTAHDLKIGDKIVHAHAQFKQTIDGFSARRKVKK